MLAALLPLISYFIVKKYSDTAVVMPRLYYGEDIKIDTSKGKQSIDTVWHQLADFKFANHLGDSISWSDLKGKIVVADFFFTRCPAICPRMTINMKRLQESIHNGQRVGDKTNDKIHFLSISIDPERDSVPRLKAWADRFQINPEQWWLLTGEKKAIYDFALEEVKLGVVDGNGVDTNFIHSDRFILIDSNRHVRGYYHGLDSASLANLSNDIVLLTMEKDPNRKSFLAGKLQLIAIVVLIAIIGVGLFPFIFKKKKSDVTTSLAKE